MTVQPGSGSIANKTGIARAWKCATTDGVPRRSLFVAAVVGSVLNLINQGDALFGANSISWLKIALTYIVPFCVATYGAVSYRRSIERANADSH